MIFLFTDFGFDGPYVGQMKAAIHAHGWSGPVTDLMHDAPRFNPKAAAYLLAASVEALPAGAVICAVVDPGVGGSRPPVVMRTGQRWYVGPGNGLFEIVGRRARRSAVYRLALAPERCSATFHGRDLFAPAAAILAAGAEPPMADLDETVPGADWPDDLGEIIYIDGYGNAMTGLRAESVAKTAAVAVGGHTLVRTRRFGDVRPGAGLCYENSLGLLEIAVNQGRADRAFDLTIGTKIRIRPGETHHV